SPDVSLSPCPSFYCCAAVARRAVRAVVECGWCPQTPGGVGDVHGSGSGRVPRLARRPGRADQVRPARRPPDRVLLRQQPPRRREGGAVGWELAPVGGGEGGGHYLAMLALKRVGESPGQQWYPQG